MKQTRTICLALLQLFLSSFSLYAQQSFKYIAALPKVDSPGFYRINLGPEVVAKCKEDLTDLRLMGPGEKFLPFINSADFPLRSVQSFAAFQEVPNPLKSDTLTAFIIEIPAKRSISQLWLRLRNTAVNRNVNLLGSDDKDHWYAIKENVQLQQSGSNKTGNYEQLLTFPSSTYRYIKIQVNDKSRTPVSILQAGIYTLQPFSTQYIPLPKPEFIKKDSLNISYVRIYFPTVYVIDNLHLVLSGPKFYNRSVQVYQKSGRGLTLLSNTSISSTSSQDLFFSVKTNNLELRIANGDNPPLTMKAVDASGKRQSVIAYLEKAAAYSVVFGDEKARKPDYDLQSFTDSIGQRLSEIGHLQVQPNPMYKKDSPKNYTLPSWIIWIAILIALSVLVLLTLKMTQEVNKNSHVDV